MRMKEGTGDNLKTQKAHAAILLGFLFLFSSGVWRHIETARRLYSARNRLFPSCFGLFFKKKREFFFLNGEVFEEFMHWKPFLKCNFLLNWRHLSADISL